MSILLSAIGAYLLGSISSAVLVSQLLRLPDPRVEGSGNPGATNVLRLGGKFPAALTLIGDVAKGTVPVVAASILTGDSTAVAAAALMAFLGHLYPVYFRFKGGKGVATALGAYLGLSVPIFVGAGLTWLAVALISRYSSLASLLAMLSAPVCAWFFLHDISIASATGIIFVFVLIRHRTNIQRLVSGQESRIKLKKA